MNGTVLLTGAIIVGVVAAGSHSHSAPRLLVGLLRADCIALPFASYSSHHWERLSFAAPTDSVEEFKRPWYFTGSSGQRSTLSGGAIVRFTGGDAFYEEWGIETDYKPCHSGVHYPAERIGAVLTDAFQVRPFQQSLGALGEPESLSPTLRADFERLERDALLKREREEAGAAWILGHPKDPAIRRQAALQVTELYETTDGDTTFVYFVVRREYAVAHADAPLSAVSVLHGWGMQSKGETIVQGLQLTLDAGSEMQVSTYIPYGMMVMEGARFVIAEKSGYESTSREVLRWTPTGASPVLPEM